MLSVSNQIRKLKEEILTLKLTIQAKEDELKKLEEKEVPTEQDIDNCRMSKRDIIRYSRQIIVPKIGVHGQNRLKNLSVLIIGVGGLGCPASQYLAGAGIGTLGLVDYDIVEENNLHRQLLHNEDQLGKPKVSSAAHSLKRINSRIKVHEYQTQLSSANAMDIVSQYDVVVDASDNVATRYLVNDACVLAGRPLVSGSALQLEGQLTVYNYSEGPCYRCLYPQPPPPGTVTNCSDAGVLGAVPGVIGTLQALEVVKIALGIEGVLSSKLLLFDGETTSFRTINLRKKNNSCPVCGPSPTIKQLLDYEEFCGASANDKDQHLSLLGEDERITPENLSDILNSSTPCILVDVRQESEFEMCSIPSSVNIPLQSLEKNVDHLNRLAQAEVPNSSSPILVCMVCRRGNDSQLAVRRLKPLLVNSLIQLKDLKGGLHSWASTVDSDFPIY